ncbi:MAG TPA: hypothetical protein DEB39_13655 [Planctomycetaceae bacterium]|nr:hypothetical protein [Planctomycetaceae bacterium]
MKPDSASHRPPDASKEIDSLCDAFEGALKEGGNPRIEEYLLKIDPRYRIDLFRELLEIEVEMRQRFTDDSESGKDAETDNGGITVLSPDPETEYRQRFPEYAEVAAQVVRCVVRPRQLGDYVLLKEIGHGGMGVVYRAVQKYLNQIVAVKVLPRRYLDEPNAVSRFRREMFLIGSLNHPNIVRALNAGESNGTHYLVMEFVDGITVQSLMQRAMNRVHTSSTRDADDPDDAYPQQKAAHDRAESADPATASAIRMPLGAACEVVRQAAEGLAHVHQFGLVHRDIKPANLMIERDGIVKILDLGLGKFSVGNLGIEQGDDVSLTKIGTMMGTTDYMAPEQWEDSGMVDIRADIYGLGCTFYFMLTNSLPYGGPRYHSQRKKMMAHMIEPVPSLDHVLGEKGGLHDAYHRMLAKEPAERFQTPDELAAAIEPYADYRELTEYLDNVLDRTPSASSEARRSQGRSSFSKGGVRRSVRRTSTSAERSSRFTILALIVVIVFILGGIVFTRMPDLIRGGTPHFQADTPGVPAVPDELVVFCAKTTALATDLAQLPGLDTPWWFDEVPWYMPFAREALARNILETLGDLETPGDSVTISENGGSPENKNDTPVALSFSGSAVPNVREAGETLRALLGDRPDMYYDPNIPEVHAWLWNTVRRNRPALTPIQWRLVEDLKKLSESNLPNEEHTGPVQEVFDRFDVSHPKDKPWSASNLHTKALLLHRLANLKGDKQLAVEAEAIYAEAIAAYSRAAAAGDRTASIMQLFCMGDCARLLPLSTGRYERSIEQFRKVADLRERRPLRSELFMINLLAAYGDTATARGIYQDQLFLRAQRMIADNPRLANRTHPLAALVKERSAWSLIDQWKVDGAAADFREALRMRETNFKETVHDPGDNPFARIYIFHDKHGLAMTYRYQGNTDRAIEEYENVFNAVAEELARVDAIPPEDRFPGFQWYRTRLLERGSNTCERSADCVLYGGAASGEVPLSSLNRAASLYEKARDMAPLNETRRIMSSKLAIVRALQGQHEDAVMILRKVDTETRSELGDLQRSDLIRRVADAMILVGSDPAGGTEKLRTILNQFRFTVDNQETIRRETLEMRLFCTEYLVDAMLKRDEPRQAIRDAANLSALYYFGNRREMRPFLRRYFDLAIRACLRSYEVDREKERLYSITELLLRSRAAESNVTPTTPPEIAPEMPQEMPESLDGPLASVNMSGNPGAVAEHTDAFTPDSPHGLAITTAENALPPSIGSGTAPLPEKPATLVLFHFTRDPKDGFAIFFPRDGREPRLFPIAYSRDQIRESQGLSLDEELVAMIQKERDDGPGIEISWSDTVCWARLKDALTDEIWPFAKQISLHQGKTGK